MDSTQHYIAPTKGNPSNLENRCSAYCIASSFDNAKLIELAKAKGEVTVFKKANVIHLQRKDSKADVFYFNYGVVVIWGLLREQEQAVLQELTPFHIGPAEAVDYDHYLYYFGSDTAKVLGNTIRLPSDDVKIKLAVSHALAQSVKLGSFESIIAKTIENTRHIPNHLAKEGKIPLTRTAITKVMGQVFSERSMVNLHTDILDTPDFFWEEPEFEPIYLMLNKDLEIDSRVEVLNTRLDALKELFDMLGAELNHRHSSRLEWVVILLIAMEICITLVQDVFHLID